MSQASTCPRAIQVLTVFFFTPFSAANDFCVVHTDRSMVIIFFLGIGTNIAKMAGDGPGLVVFRPVIL